MTFYGMLHVNAADGHMPNHKAGDAEQSLDLYFRNAVTLAASLRRVGCDFTLLTNDVARLERLGRGADADLSLRSVPFHLSVPEDVPFYSAHFKLDVFRWFASAADPYPILIDLDMVALRRPSPAFGACIEARLPMAYDISDQVFPAFGETTITGDLARLTGNAASITRWFGGEFIGGPPAFFGELIAHIDRLWAGYCGCYSSLHHKGDEGLTSPALCQMLQEGRVVVDAGPIGGVGRYWSNQPLHPQKPLAWFEQCFLLHLPSDKPFIARQSRRPFLADRFRRAYRRHLFSVWPRRQLRRIFRRVSGKSATR
jgi:hypothetical protein